MYWIYVFQVIHIFSVYMLQNWYSPSNREFVMNDLGHYLFKKMDCAIRRKVGHGMIVSCFGQRNMIYKLFIKI